MKHVLIFICIGVTIVLSIAFASYYVLTQFQPDREIARMLVAMSEVKTFSHSDGFTWTQIEGEDRANTSLYVSGQVDVADPAHIEHETQFRFVRLSKTQDYNDLSGEVRVLKDKTYLTYTAPGPEVPGVTFDGKTWIAFDQDEFPAWGSVIPGLQLPVRSVLSPLPWTDEGMARLRLLLTVADVFQVTFDGLTELIGGVNTRIIDATFDPEALRSFLLGLIRSKEGREPTDDERLQVETQAKQLERLSLRLWIGERDHLLYRLQAIGGLTQEGTNELIPTDMRFDLFGFNEPYVSHKPESLVSFARVLQSSLRNLPETSDTSRLSGWSEQDVLLKNDQGRLPTQQVLQTHDRDNDGLDNILETFYGTDVNNPDTDGDGMNDGDEVLSARSPTGDGSLFGFGLDR